ncbi:hypothetical protein ZIOFF_060645 [Zingiber officinale]|uniref:Reverse transcriptase domain-containing protein n=1 Tax=Zingiber officinale TaxID=94328 RepID=A0A8J5KL58_ZINOF|nr:hypothetical protein ZIOFF_060645 [Zingiber officinale]
MGILEPFIELDEALITRRLGFESAISNCSSKIWFLHDANIACVILVDHEHVLHLKIRSQLLLCSIFISVVYAKCNSGERRILWERLMDVKSIDDVCWLVGGDFNVISSIDEQSNDVLSRSGAIKEFNDVLMLSGLSDLGFVGDRFTWTNKRIWKRLDRILISPSWNVKDLVIKLGRLKEYLKWWNKDVFGNIHDKVKLEEERYAEAERKFDADPSVENRNLLANEVEVLHTDGMKHIPALIGTDENIALSNNPTIKEECWETIKEDVLEAVLDFSMVGHSQGLVANRLNSVMHKLTSPSQSGFVKGRLISDNIHLAQELNHKLNYRVRGGNLILKLDMAKAYDRVQWVFLLNVMKAFGFSDHFMDIIKRCIANC